MSKYKKVRCKCSKCNKPFSAMSTISLCAECRRKEEETELNKAGHRVAHRAVRSFGDSVMESLALLNARTSKEYEDSEAEVKAREAEEERKNSIHSENQCKDCCSWFVITVGEKEFYEANGLDLPKRCPACRAARKTNKLK